MCGSTMYFQAGTCKPCIVKSEVTLDGIGRNCLAITIVNPPAPGWQHVLYTDVVPFMIESCYSVFLEEHTVA